MKVEILKENLKAGLDIVEKVIGKNISLPILDNVLISAEETFIKLTSTDLETAVTLWMLGKIVKKGKASVPARVLSGFVSLLPNEKIILEESGQNLQITGGSFKNKIQGLNAEEFPIIPVLTEAKTRQVDSQALYQGISQVIDIIQPSQTRTEISGIYCIFSKNLITLVATDSFRLAEKKIFIDGAGEEISFILPQKPAKEVMNILNQKQGKAKLSVTQNQAMVEIPMKDVDHPEVQVVSRLIEGEYPQYEEIIPKNFKTTVVAKRDELLNQIKAAALFAGKINEIKVRADITAKKLEIVSQDAEVGENYSDLPVKAEGENIEISFNYKFLIDGLLQMRSSEVAMSFSKEDGPCLLRPVGDDTYLYVVMPIKA